MRKGEGRAGRGGERDAGHNSSCRVWGVQFKLIIDEASRRGERSKGGADHPFCRFRVFRASSSSTRHEGEGKGARRARGARRDTQ